MTATRDRRSDPAEDDADTAWDDRPILGTSRGVPWWGGVLLAFGLATVAAVVDMVRQDSLGIVYQGGYLLGCVGAICWVRRRSLFGPMVQPPLVFAVTAIGAVILLAPDSGGSGLRNLLFTVALPLTSNFPTMAITTGITVAVGLYRLWKERDPNPPVRQNIDRAKDRPPREDRPSRGADAPAAGRKERPSKDRAAPAPRPGRGRPDPAADEEPPAARRGMRGRPTREPRSDRRDPSPRDRTADRRDRDRDQPPADRGSRRPRDEDPPARRRSQSEPRARRDERPAPSRRDQSERGNQPRPRRRPPEQYR